MTDSNGLYAGIKPLENAREPNYSDMIPSSCLFGEKNNMVRNHMPGYFTPPSKTPSEFNDTIFRSTLKQVLPVKGDINSVRYGRAESSLTAHMYPSQGYARGQHLGLASDNDKPMDLPIMGITGYFDINMVNVLGNLPG